IGHPVIQPSNLRVGDGVDDRLIYLVRGIEMNESICRRPDEATTCARGERTHPGGRGPRPPLTIPKAIPVDARRFDIYPIDTAVAVVPNRAFAQNRLGIPQASP